MQGSAAPEKNAPDIDAPIEAAPRNLAARLGAWVGEAAFGSRAALKWLAFLAVIGGYLWHSLFISKLFLHNACDDAFISFRYVRVLIDHGELAYNPGERVEGYSNLLWMLLLTPLSLLGIELVQASRILGLFFGSLCILASAIGLRICLGVRSFAAQLGAAIIMASSGFFASWSVMGLESTLHAFVLLCAWLTFMRELIDRRGGYASAFFLGALVLTRPEGLLVAGGAILVRIAFDAWQHRQSKGALNLRFYLWLGLIVFAFELFRVLYFGPYLWPNAVRAKVGSNSEQYLRGLRYVYDNFLRNYIYLFAPLAALGSWLRKAPSRAAGFILFFGYTAFFAMAGGDWSVGRFFAPLIPLGATCFACMLDDLLASDTARPQWLSPAFALLAAVGLGGYSYYGSSKNGEQKFAAGFAGLDAQRVELGKWIAQNSPKDAKVALYAAGQIAYYSDRYAHDMLGLNDSHIAAIKPKDFGKGPAGHEKYDVEYTLNTVRPTFIVQPHLIPGMMQHPTFAQYQELPGFGQSWVLRSYWNERERARIQR